MTFEQKVEKVTRLEVAYTTTKDTLESQPTIREFHPGSDIASKWGMITAAYSGLEQAIKYLIAEEKSYTIEELINQQEQSGTGRNSVNPYKTHDLASLFSRLEDETKSVIIDYYSQFQSLHSYITIEKLDDFLSEVSGVRGRGYELWRYTLIQDEEHLPRNSTEAMVAIWGICVQISLSRIDDEHSMQTLKELLVRELYEILLTCIAEIEANVANTGNPIPDLELEANEQLFRDDHELNVFAKILQHFGCFKSHGIANLSNQLSQIVDCWQKKVSDIGKEEGHSSLRWFINRASGRTPYGESIRWKPESNRFVDFAWTLDLISKKSLPKSAITIKTASHYHYLQQLKCCANECGYTVRQNRSYTNPLDPDETDYYRTLEVCQQDTKEPVITVWQKPRSLHEFSFVVEQTENKIMPQVQNWISFVRRRSK